MNWTCATCETLNEETHDHCEVCGAERVAEMVWACPNCETLNPDYHHNCEVCGMDRIDTLLVKPGEVIVEGHVAAPLSPPVVLREAVGTAWETPGRIRLKDKTWKPVEVRETALVAGSSASLPDRVTVAGRNFVTWFRGLPKRRKRKLINWSLISIGILSVVSGSSALFGYFIAGLLGFIAIRAMSPRLKSRWEKLMDPLPSDPKLFLPTSRSPVVEREEKGHSYPIMAMSFSREGDQLISLDNRSNLIRWDVVTGERIRSASVFKDNPDKVVLGRLGAFVLIEGKIRYYNASAKLKQTLLVDMPVSPDSALTLSPSNNLIAIGSSFGRVKYWDLVRNKHKELREVIPGNIVALEVFAGDRYLAAGTDSGGVMVWEIGTGNVIMQDSRVDVRVTDLSILDNGSHLTAAYDDGEIRTWGLHSRKGLGFYNMNEFKAAEDDDMVLYPAKIQYSPESRKLVTADQMGLIRIFDMHEMNDPVLVAELSGSSTQVTHLAVSSQGKWLASGGADGRVAMFFIGKY